MTSEQKPYRQTDQPAQRPALRRGAGTLLDDLQLPRMVHAAFPVRPIRTRISCQSTRRAGRLMASFMMTGRELSKIAPLRGGATHIPSLRA